MARVLTAHGASLEARVGPATLREHLAQALPNLRPEAIHVKRPPDLLSGLKGWSMRRIITLV